jgi:hypothetical protein
MLRHTLATLSYRAATVVRGAPNGFGDVRQAAESRSASEIMAHMGDLIDWAASIVQGRETWAESPVQSWDADVERFFASVARLDALLAGPPGGAAPAERLFQGPIADALTHVGQLAMLRRLAGAPMRGQNYSRADIVAGRVGIDQVPPKREF